MHVLRAFTALSGAIAVMMGAAAAHWLTTSMGAEDLARIEKAAYYQMVHTLACLVLVTNTTLRAPLATTLLLIGIVLFSGSLYVYSFTHLHALVYITPLGGLSFIAGWLALAVAAWRTKTR